MCVRTAGRERRPEQDDDKLKVLIGDLSDKATGTYNIITANIVANAILSLAPHVPALMAPGATFIASGVVDTRRDEVVEGLRAVGLNVVEVREQNGWVAILCKKRGGAQDAAPLFYQRDLRRHRPPHRRGRPSSGQGDAGQNWRAGDPVRRDGFDYDGVMTAIEPDQVQIFSVANKRPCTAEPKAKVTVFAGYPKQDKLELILQKSVELGAERIVPFFSRFCVVTPKKEDQKNQRYARIAAEAAKQCGRGILPEVELPLNISQLPGRFSEIRRDPLLLRKGRAAPASVCTRRRRPHRPDHRGGRRLLGGGSPGAH